MPAFQTRGYTVTVVSLNINLVKVYHTGLPQILYINYIILLTLFAADHFFMRCIHEYVLCSTLLQALFQFLIHCSNKVSITGCILYYQITFQLFPISKTTFQKLYAIKPPPKRQKIGPCNYVHIKQMVYSFQRSKILQ